MYLVREVFNTKPGKAKELVKMFKAVAPHFAKSQEMKNIRIMSDVVGPYWTVVFESEVSDLGEFFGGLRSATMSDEAKEIMKNYLDCVAGGRREIYVLE